MQSGLLKIPNCARGVIRLWREVRVVILWRVYVEKVSATCAVNLGNLTIKITSNAIFSRKEMMMKSAERKQFSKN